MALNSVYRVRMRATFLGQRVEWGVHIQQVQATGGPDDLAASFAANVLPLAVAATSAGVNWDEVLVMDTSETGSESVHLPFTQPAPGALVGDVLPPQNAVVVSLSTGQKGRRRHGRFYVPGITESANTNGVISGAQLTAIEALAQGMINLYGPTGTEISYRMVIYSPEELDAPPVKAFKPRPGTLITNVTAAATNATVRTQRHRAIGVGR